MQEVKRHYGEITGEAIFAIYYLVPKSVTLKNGH